MTFPQQIGRSTERSESDLFTLLDRFADWPWLDRIREEGPDAVYAAMAEEVRFLANPER